MAGDEEREVTTVQIERPLHRRLKKIRPYDSMSFHDLIEEMADVYAREKAQEVTDNHR